MNCATFKVITAIGVLGAWNRNNLTNCPREKKSVKNKRKKSQMKSWKQRQKSVNNQPRKSLSTAKKKRIKITREPKLWWCVVRWLHPRNLYFLGDLIKKVKRRKKVVGKREKRKGKERRWEPRPARMEIKVHEHSPTPPAAMSSQLATIRRVSTSCVP